VGIVELRAFQGKVRPGAVQVALQRSAKAGEYPSADIDKHKLITWLHDELSKTKRGGRRPEDNSAF